jgi:hypothetical protein
MVTDPAYKKLIAQYQQAGRKIQAIDYQMVKDKPKNSMSAYRKRQRIRQNQKRKAQTKQNLIMKKMETRYAQITKK